MTIPKRVAVTEVSHWHSVNDASYLRVTRFTDRRPKTQVFSAKVAGCRMQPTKGGGRHGSSAVRSRCREAAAEPSELVELPGVALLQC